MPRALHDGVTDIPGTVGTPGLGLLGLLDGSGNSPGSSESGFARIKGGHCLFRAEAAIGRVCQTSRQLWAVYSITSIHALARKRVPYSREQCTPHRPLGLQVKLTNSTPRPLGHEFPTVTLSRPSIGILGDGGIPPQGDVSINASLPPRSHRFSE
jgi:hypothetical protein